MLKRFLYLLPFLVFLLSCSERWEYYEIPPMEGVLYDQLKADPEQRFITFLEAIDRVPNLKEELSTSGLYTILAPTNEAFTAFFNSKGTTLAQISEDDLTTLIKFHILRWMIFSYQFNSPGVDGESYDIFRYQSRASVANAKDVSNTGKEYNLYYDPKRLHVYTRNFFGSQGVTASDYSELFGQNSPFSSYFNVLGSSVTNPDIASGNGVIHVIDKVLEVRNNILQEMESDPGMSKFTDLFKSRYITYTYDNTATMAQPNNGDPRNTGEIDSLWRRVSSLPGVSPYIDYETHSMNPLFTVFIPSNNAFDQYVNSFINEFGGEKSVPYYIWEILYKAHFCSTMNWPSKVADTATGFVTAMGEKYVFTSDKLLDKRMTTNGILYKVENPVESHHFTSVPGPALTSNNYTILGHMLIATGVASTIAKPEDNFIFLAPDNQTMADAEINMNIDPQTGRITFERYSGDAKIALTTRALLNFLNSFIIVLPETAPNRLDQLSDGLYETLGGSYIKIKDGKVLSYGLENPLSMENEGIKMTNGLFCKAGVFMEPPLNYYQMNTVFDNSNYFYNALLIYERYVSGNRRTYSVDGLDFIDIEDRTSVLLPENDAFRNMVMSYVPNISSAIFNVVFATAGGTVPAPLQTTAFWEALEDIIRIHFLKGKVASGKIGDMTEIESYALDRANSRPGKEIFRKVKVKENHDLSIEFRAVGSDGIERVTATSTKNNIITQQGVNHSVLNCLR